MTRPSENPASGAAGTSREWSAGRETEHEKAGGPKPTTPGVDLGV